jgi:hypothetical protein
MPEGERAFVNSKGPRRKITLLIPADTHLLLKVGGDGSAPAQAVKVLEQWADDFLEVHAAELRSNVAERRAREAAPAKRRRSSGRSVQGD